MNIPIQASDKEVTRLLKEAGLLSEYAGFGKDKEYERYVLKPINSLQAAYAFMETLMRQAYHADPRRACHAEQKRIDICSKVAVARARYESEDRFGFILESPAWPLSSARRTCCGCHETCSFKPDYHWVRHRTHKERVKVAYYYARCYPEGVGYRIVNEDGSVFGHGDTPAGAWAAADSHLEEAFIRRWWQGNGRNLAPAMHIEGPDLEPCIARR